MKKNLPLLVMLFTLSLMLPAGCSLPERSRAGSGEQQQPAPVEPRRFQVICEEGETKNLGGFTVIRDNQTGKEYLIVTGLNGAPTVVNLQTEPGAAAK
ncbi:MAG: hypothetical protein K6T80_00935 [Firmicutes bacterium]|nr:hypothetical protein [Bacillota bacterium]